jgi:hypothetical protein
MKLPFYKWVDETERTISKSVSSCTPRDWNEDFISRTWLRELTDAFPQVHIEDGCVPYRIAWDAFKAVGNVEQEHGDIAVLVRLNFKRGAYLEGVAFLEAKRIYDTRYEALKHNQLRHHSSNISNHRLLLYDNQPLSWPKNIRWNGDMHYPCPFFRYDKVHAFTLPSSHALAFGSKDRDLNNLSQPLSWQICWRYLRGLDIDNTESLVEAVKQGVPDRIKYILVANVSLDPEVDVSTEAIEINRNALSELRNDEDV